MGLTVVGMVAYLLTGPKNLSLIGGAMAALSLPMLALMVISFVFPIGGVFGHPASARCSSRCRPAACCST